MKEFLNLLLPVLGGIDWITDGFISAIVLYAILSGIWFLLKTFRRRSLIDGLSRVARAFNRPAQPSIIHELKEKFAYNGEFAEAWQEFEDSLITRQLDQNQSLVYKTDEASLFFSEERLLEQHLNLRYWNSVPALLVGLGILGTFVGLVWGLIPFSGINFTQTEGIRSAIQALLSGVSTAFITSVWGMFTSLLFNGLEKWRIGRVSRAIVNLQRALDQLFTLTTQEEIAFRQEDELTQQTAALKSFSTDLANEIKSAMTQGRQEIIHELHNAPEAFSNAIAEQLVPSLHSLNTVVEELRAQKEESSTVAIEKLIEQFQGSLSASTVTQMEELAKTVGDASQSLMNLPDQMTRMMTGVQEQIEQTSQLLATTTEEQAGQMKNIMDEMLNALQKGIDTQQAGLSETTDKVNEEMKQVATDIRNLLESVAHRTDEQLSKRMADMETVSNKSIQTLQSAIDELQESITSTASQTAEKSAVLINRMHQLIDQTTIRLGESVQSAEKSINTLLGQQADQTKAFSAQLANSQETLETGSKMLEHMNESLTSVRQMISTTQAFSRQLTGGADRLEQAGQQLTRASDAFNQENERYLAANRETTEQIQAAVGHLNDSVQRFQTIDNGLRGIFAEIEEGLNTYATTSRESINQYLNDFSDQLAQASRALSGSVEALTDIVEDVTDTNERLARRGGNK